MFKVRPQDNVVLESCHGCFHILIRMGEKRRYNVERAFSFKAGKVLFFDNRLEERRLANMPPRACVVKRRARRHVHKSPPADAKSPPIWYNVIWTALATVAVQKQKQQTGEQR
jgi:hypothetical protein